MTISHSFTDHSQKGETTQAMMIDLIKALFASNPSIQDATIRYLVDLSFPFRTHIDSSFMLRYLTDNIDKRTSQATNRELLSSSNHVMLRKSLFALAVIDHLAACRHDLGNLMIQLLTNRLSAEKNNRIELIHPLILSRYLESIIKTTAYSHEVESTLTIMIHKFLASFNEPDYVLAEILSCRISSSSSDLSSRIPIDRAMTMTGDHTRRHLYNMRSIGFLLVDAMIIVKSEMSVVDRHSWFQSMEKTLFLVHDDSIFYLINSLASISLGRKKISGSAFRGQPTSSSSSSSMHSSVRSSDVSPGSNAPGDEAWAHSSIGKMLSKLIASYPFIR
jgi:hypothetical protein